MVKYTEEENKLICNFSGTLNTANCTKWEEEIYNKIDSADGVIVFDLNGVEYIASAFLRICVRVGKKVGADNFSIINVSPMIKKVFKMSGFDKFIKID